MSNPIFLSFTDMRIMHLWQTGSNGNWHEHNPFVVFDFAELISSPSLTCYNAAELWSLLEVILFLLEKLSALNEISDWIKTRRRSLITFTGRRLNLDA